MKLIFKTRKGTLRAQILNELKSGSPDLQNILNYVDQYEQKNLDKIEKLVRKRTSELRRINGALKQTINVHGPITKELIGSASKRIYGALLEKPKPSFIQRLINFFK